ncbi:transketolase C-terminal domain-containing protein, partial [Anaeromyxobacter diazotrophicus]|uniref:transketolase C-terminal domain-containing protein n=1 Tax=Anaeromyxobacter diazotrophicus TaxID=2590199 RepID=UPI0027E4C682
LFCELAASARRVVTVEEGALMGGFGAACLEAFERGGVLPGLQVKRLGLPDAFVTHGDAGKQRAELGFDAAGIAAAARELVGDRAARGVA